MLGIKTGLLNNYDEAWLALQCLLNNKAVNRLIIKNNKKCNRLQFLYPVASLMGECRCNIIPALFWEEYTLKIKKIDVIRGLPLLARGIRTRYRCTLHRNANKKKPALNGLF